MLTENTPVVHPWLSHIASAKRGLVSAWFEQAMRQGATDAESLVRETVKLVGHKQDWSIEPSSRHLCSVVLETARVDRQGALSFAQSISDARGAA